MSALTATRPIERSWPCAAMPVVMLANSSGATIMRISRRNRSPRKCVCTAKRGASRPSSTPASMARNVHSINEGRDSVASANSTIAMERSAAPGSAWPSRPRAKPPSHNGMPVRARIAESLTLLPGVVSVWLGMIGRQVCLIHYVTFWASRLDGLQLHNGPLQVHCCCCHVRIFQAGSGVEEDHAIRGFEETIGQQLVIGGGCGSPFGRQKDPLVACPIENGSKYLVIA